MIKSRKQMFITIGAFVLTLLLGTTTYAFFNYTRTGGANTIKTGRIAFNSSQGTAINLTNMFPIDVSEGIPNDATKVGTLTINVTGDTTYTDGLEYKVSAVNVSNTVGNKTLPISVNVSVENNSNNDPATTLGTAITGEGNYYTSRGSTTSVYKVVAGNTISSDDELLIGYIAPGATGVDGNIVIKAYLDARNIAISDTYPEGDVTHTEGEEPNQTTVTDYTNGTTDNWVGEREVFTTTEWNSLQANGVSFQIKVESNEGIWIDEPAPPYPTIASCQGCKFVSLIDGNIPYYYTAANDYSEPLSTTATFAENGETLVDDYTTLNTDSFLGFKFDTNGNITNAYACGIKGEDPNNGVAFCIEGSTNGSTYSTNQTLLNHQDTGIWKGGCTVDSEGTYCNGFVNATSYVEGIVTVGVCGVYASGYADCS